MTRERISNQQLIIVLIIIRIIVALSKLPLITTGTAAQDAWASSLILGASTILIGIIITGLGVKFPRQTIIQYSQVLLGKWGGKLISLIPLWLFLQIAATDLRLYGELVKTSFLPRTPLSFILASMVLLSALCVYLGIEVLGRMADFVIVYFALAVISTLIIPVPEIISFNFEPVLSSGIAPVISSSLTPTAISVHLLVIGILLPHTVEPEKGIKSVLIAVGISSLIMTLITIIVTGKLGPVHAQHSAFPLLKTIRGIESSEFLERLEILAVLAWGLGLFIGISTFIYCGARGLSQLLELDNYRPLVGPMAVIWVTLAMHGYDSMFQLDKFLSPEFFFPYLMGLFLLVYIPLWGAYLIRKIKYKQ